jgi:integrase
VTLTAPNVARLRAAKSGKYSWHPDKLLPSFGLRVYNTGRKSWGITRRWAGAKHPAFKRIGDYPHLGLAAARHLAEAILRKPERMAELVAAAAAGPAGEPEPEQPSTDELDPDSFRMRAEEFLAHGRTKRGRVLRANTAREYRRALMIHAAGLHARPVPTVRRADVAGLIRAVAAERGAMTAMRTRAALSRFFGWMIANELVESNPVTGTEGYSAEPRSRTMKDGELAAIWQATGDGSDFGLILRLLLWTGCRRSEAGGMRWSEVEDGTWTVPAERTKNHRPLVLPLPRQALAALQAHPRWVGRDHVFGRTPVGFQGWSYPKRRLDDRLAFARPWDLHDLRRTVETGLRKLGTSSDVVNRILNHAMTQIEAAYNHHDYLAEKRVNLQEWADHLEHVVANDKFIVELRARP